MNYQLLQGDCIEVMRTLPANSCQVCVTSPPYFGLRAYLDNGDPNKPLEIGTEETPEAYVAKLVDVFREVRRLLHPTGVLFLNLGDSYWGGKGQSGYELPHEAEARRGRGETLQHAHNVPGYTNMRPTDGKHPVIKPKDLIGIPWLVAFALRADGWWLRSEIIWHKRAPMPESVTDRPTKAHEQVFLLAKSATYYYDQEAIAEQASMDSGYAKQRLKGVPTWGKRDGFMNHNGNQDNNTLWQDTGKRNKRSVWTLGPESYSGAHFATMPTKLVEPCILAGTSAHGCCAKCGAPWERVVEREAERYNEREGIAQALRNQGASNGGTERVTLGVTQYVHRETTGWQPTCQCQADVVPCTVLDPFNGSGTTGAVALKHHRNYIGIDLNADYLALAHERIQRSQPTLFELTT